MAIDVYKCMRKRYTLQLGSPTLQLDGPLLCQETKGVAGTTRPCNRPPPYNDLYVCVCARGTHPGQRPPTVLGGAPTLDEGSLQRHRAVGGRLVELRVGGVAKRREAAEAEATGDLHHGPGEKEQGQKGSVRAP